jgi:hypothetical protein
MIIDKLEGNLNLSTLKQIINCNQKIYIKKA